MEIDHVIISTVISFLLLIQDDSGIFFLALHLNLCCEYSLEAPLQGTSNENLQHMYLWRNKKNYHRILAGLSGSVDAHPTSDQEVVDSTPPGWQHSFVEI